MSLNKGQEKSSAVQTADGAHGLIEGIRRRSGMDAEDLLLALSAFADLQTAYWTTPSLPGEATRPPLFAEFLAEIEQSLAVDAEAEAVTASVEVFSSEENSLQSAADSWLTSPEEKATAAVVSSWSAVSAPVADTRSEPGLLLRVDMDEQMLRAADLIGRPTDAPVGAVLFERILARDADVVVRLRVLSGRPNVYAELAAVASSSVSEERPKIIERLPPFYDRLAGTFSFQRSCSLTIEIVDPTLPASSSVDGEDKKVEEERSAEPAPAKKKPAPKKRKKADAV